MRVQGAVFIIMWALLINMVVFAQIVDPDKVTPPAAILLFGSIPLLIALVTVFTS